MCAAKRANESNVRNAGWRNGTGKWGVSAVCVNVGLRTRVDSLHCAAFDDKHAGVTAEASSSGAGALRPRLVHSASMAWTDGFIRAVCVNVGLQTRVDSLHHATFDEEHAGVRSEASK